MDKKDDSKKKRYYNIDFLRIIFISAILLHHFLHAATGHWNTGGYAVELFFIISGFIFNLTYKNNQSAYEFVIGKLTRFIPLLCITSLILALSTKFRIQKFLADIFLLQKTGLYTTDGGFGYNGPAWFISVLFWVLLFIFYLRKTTSQQITNLTIGVLTFISLYVICNNYHFLYDGPRIFRGLATIGLGYLGAEIAKNISIYISTKKSKLITFIEILITIYISQLIFTTAKIPNKTGIFFLAVILLILFVVQKGYFSTILNKPIFTRLALYSFPVYITHPLLYYPHPIFKYFNQVCNNTTTICTLGFIASWTLGVFAYHLLQTPIEKYLNKILKAQSRETE